MPSAAIVFYCINYRTGEVHFLLGRETYHPGFRESDRWAGFGGKTEGTETAFQTAARECYEETAGSVMSLPELNQALELRHHRIAVSIRYKKGLFQCFFLQILYRDYPTSFRLTRAFCQHLHANITCVEKSVLRWFSYEELRRSIAYDPAVAAPSRHGNNRVPFFRHKFADVMRLVFQCPEARAMLETPPGACPPLELHPPEKNEDRE